VSRVRPETPAFIDHAPLRVRATRDLGAGAEAVFDALADAEGWERWFPGMRRCEWLTPAPHGVGSQRAATVDALHLVERFVVWDRPHHWGFTFTEVRPPILSAGVELVELEDLGRGCTRVTHTMALRPALRLPLAGAIARSLESRLATGLAGLERHVAASRP
jgi:uncharacterized protein YndB with AHSA1/START domain